jgi:hypothetical protein
VGSAARRHRKSRRAEFRNHLQHRGVSTMNSIIYIVGLVVVVVAVLSFFGLR